MTIRRIKLFWKKEAPTSCRGFFIFTL